MKRKVIKQGHNTLTVTLPSKWVVKNSIKAGDELDLDEIDSCLSISSSKVKCRELSTTFDTGKKGHFKNNYINCLYHAGFDKIEIKYHKPELMQEINKRIRDYCPGFEVVEQHKSTCVIKSVSSVIEEDFDNLVRRIFLMFISLLEDMQDILKTKEYDRLVNIRNLEGLNNRYTSYCKRILNKVGYHDPRKTVFYYVLMYDLETIADDYKHLSDYISLNKDIVTSEKVIGLLDDIIVQFRTFYELFYKFDKDKASYIFVEAKELFEKGLKLLENTKTKEKIIIHFLLNTIVKTYELTEPYIEMNLFSD